MSNFSDYIQDLNEVISHLMSEYGMKDYLIMGHSMDAEITCGWLQNFADNHMYPAKIIVTSPPVSVGGPLEKLAKKMPYRFVKLLADIEFSLPLKGLVDLKGLSHDPQVAIDYINNEHTCTKLHTKLAFNIVKGLRDIFSRPINPKCPAFIMIGTKDKVVSYHTNIGYFKDIEKQFIYKEFEGARHELHNEIPVYRGPFIKYSREIIFS